MSSHTARFASVTPWCGPNIASTISATHDLNKTLEKTSANDPVNMPLDATWIVRWSRFFEIEGSKPNFSRRIGPYLSDGLGNDQIFPAFDDTNRVGLFYRDLLGAALAGLWSVDALIAEIAARRPQFIAMSGLLADRPYRVGQLRAWLASEPAYGGLTPKTSIPLSNDPPLPFFILFEAMQQPTGGPVSRASGFDHRIGSDFWRARQ